MGHLHKALVTYERAFQLDPDDPELLINLGLTAWNLKLTEGAAKMFQLYIAACPDSPLGYNNLGSVQCDLGHPDVAHRDPARRDLPHARTKRSCGIRWPPCWPKKAAPTKA